MKISAKVLTNFWKSPILILCRKLKVGMLSSSSSK